ncbi:hypothetical protein F511_31926 [Dorcoceras hygrometricum]|uniref:Uncharacterized protein n=1 Tax=Dorcoceras hygrometricum TaxID=472368 RepID=A0A2Z7DEJ1_9LAMI|nr:hypothetical protein F511_31926 [Dorcoceras hygrometricum]
MRGRSCNQVARRMQAPCATVRNISARWPASARCSATMIKVDGSWVIEPCVDFWKPLPRPVVCTEVPRQLSYVDTLPPGSESFKQSDVQINHVERVFLDSLAEKNETFRGLFKRSHQEAQNDNNAPSFALKAVRTQNAILLKDLAATQKEVKDLQVALSKDFYDKLADIRNELLEFRVETQGQLASLDTHLAELISFLTKGSDDKKGKIVAAAALNRLPMIKTDQVVAVVTDQVVAVVVDQMIRADMVESLSAEMLEQDAAVVKVGEEVIRVDQRENDPVVVVSRRFVVYFMDRIVRLNETPNIGSRGRNSFRIYSFSSPCKNLLYD